MKKRFARISTAIWSSADWLQLDWDLRHTYIYLLTCDQGNLYGFYFLSINRSAKELHIVRAQLLARLKQLHERELIQFDAACKIVLVRDWWTHNRLDHVGQLEFVLNKDTAMFIPQRNTEMLLEFYEQLLIYANFCNRGDSWEAAVKRLQHRIAVLNRDMAKRIS